MFKKLLSILAGLLVAGGAMAGPLQFTAATIQTNGAALTTQTPDDSGFAEGYIESVIIDFTAGNTETNTITFTTLAGGGFGAARTFLTLSNVTGDGTWPARDLVTTQAGADITGMPARFLLLQNKIRMTATSNGNDTNATAVTMNVYVNLTDKP